MRSKRVDVRWSYDEMDNLCISVFRFFHCTRTLEMCFSFCSCPFIVLFSPAHALYPSLFLSRHEHSLFPQVLPFSDCLPYPSKCLLPRPLDHIPPIVIFSSNFLLRLAVFCLVSLSMVYHVVPCGGRLNLGVLTRSF